MDSLACRNHKAIPNRNDEPTRMDLEETSPCTYHSPFPKYPGCLVWKNPFCSPRCKLNRTIARKSGGDRSVLTCAYCHSSFPEYPECLIWRNPYCSPRCELKDVEFDFREHSSRFECEKQKTDCFLCKTPMPETTLFRFRCGCVIHEDCVLQTVRKEKTKCCPTCLQTVTDTDVLALVNLARKKELREMYRCDLCYLKIADWNDILLNCGCVGHTDCLLRNDLHRVIKRNLWNVRDTKGRLEIPEVEYPPFE